METRPYFLLGDLFSNLLAGAVVGLVCAALVGESWSPPLAMVSGMVLGMFVILPIEIACGLLFGAFEVMLPMMLTGTVAGMIVAMAAAMGPLSLEVGAKLGAGLGFAMLAFTYLVNALLRGEVRRWTP